MIFATAQLTSVFELAGVATASLTLLERMVCTQAASLRKSCPSATPAFAFLFLTGVGSDVARLKNGSKLDSERVLSHHACQRIINACLVLTCGSEYFTKRFPISFLCLTGVTGHIPEQGNATMPCQAMSSMHGQLLAT